MIFKTTNSRHGAWAYARGFYPGHVLERTDTRWKVAPHGLRSRHGVEVCL